MKSYRKIPLFCETEVQVRLRTAASFSLAVCLDTRGVVMVAHSSLRSN